MKAVLKIGLLCTVLLLTGCDRINMGNKETETELAEGQRKAQITVMSIVGNELTYREMETEALETETESETENETENEAESARGAKGGGRMSSGEGPFGGSGGEMTRGGFSEGNIGEMSRGGFAGTTFSGETVYLSVGVKVHADNGKVSGFSILEEGDTLQVLFETREDGTEMITEIWMEGTY